MHALSKGADYAALDADTDRRPPRRLHAPASAPTSRRRAAPAAVDGRQRTFAWTEVLAWYVGYKISLERYTGPDSADEGGSDPIRRKDTAVAALKELDLEQRRGMLVPMADVSRVLQDVAKGLQVEILGLPNRITGQVLAIREQVEMSAYLTAEATQLCTRLSQLHFIPSTDEPEPEDEDA